MAVPARRMPATGSPALAPVRASCRACLCRMNAVDILTDDGRLVCVECRGTPAGKALGYPPPRGHDAHKAPRPFTAADRSLIKQVQALMPPAQLLGLLNERLLADLGEDAPRYTMEQLHAEIAATAAAIPEVKDWSGLRKLMGQARRSGLLDKINAQTINDFAVVFSLTPAQVLRLKDAVLDTKGGRR